MYCITDLKIKKHFLLLTNLHAPVPTLADINQSSKLILLPLCHIVHFSYRKTEESVKGDNLQRIKVSVYHRSALYSIFVTFGKVFEANGSQGC